MAQSLITILCFGVMGLLGGVTHCIIWAESWGDLKTFKYSKKIILGAITGVLYSFLYSDYNFPDFVMSFVAGYMGQDFFLALIEKLKPKPVPS